MVFFRYICSVQQLQQWTIAFFLDSLPGLDHLNQMRANGSDFFRSPKIENNLH